MVNWGAQWSCNQNVIITNSLIWIIPPLRRYSRPAASVWYSSPSRSLSEMIIDRCDMGVTSDISPRVSACKSEHINIDLCGARLVVRVRVMDRLWLTLPGQRARWRSRHCRRLTSCHALIIIDVCVCVCVLTSANTAALFVRLLYGSATQRWRLYASSTLSSLLQRQVLCSCWRWCPHYGLIQEGLLIYTLDVQLIMSV